MAASNATQLGYGGPEFVAVPFDVLVPLTAFSITPSGSITVLNPAGTLATGTFTLPASPGDGQQVSLTSSQTQTALTVAAATGDTINAPAVTALVAGTTVGWRYKLSTRVWFRTV